MKRLLKSAKEKLTEDELLSIYKEAQLVAIESVMYELDSSIECDFKYPCFEYDGIVRAKKIIKKTHPKSYIVEKIGNMFRCRKFK